MFYGATLRVNYGTLGDGVTGYIVTIWPSTHNFINRKNSQNLPWEQAWPLNLLKKESISQIEIMGPSGAIINSSGD